MTNNCSKHNIICPSNFIFCLLSVSIFVYTSVVLSAYGKNVSNTNKDLLRTVICNAYITRRIYIGTFRNWFKYFQGPQFFSRTFQVLKNILKIPGLSKTLGTLQIVGLASSKHLVCVSFFRTGWILIPFHITSCFWGQSEKIHVYTELHSYPYYIQSKTWYIQISIVMGILPS